MCAIQYTTYQAEEEWWEVSVVNFVRIGEFFCTRHADNTPECAIEEMKKKLIVPVFQYRKLNFQLFIKIDI